MIGTELQRYFQSFVDGLAAKGRDMNISRHYAQLLREEGRKNSRTRFKTSLMTIKVVDVVEEKFFCPCNPWPENPALKTVGQFMMTDIYGGLRGVGWKAHRAAGLTADEIESLVNQTKDDLNNGKHRIYTTKAEIEPLFPFGHGLSYTTFSLSSPRLSLASEASNEASVTVTVMAI
jgi:hypothetical protein